MFKKTLSLSIVSAALFCGAAFAQETTQEEQSQEAAPQTETGSNLDLGESGPRIGEQYIAEEIGSWTLTCIKTETDDDPCAIRQVLLGPQNQPVAEVTIEKLPESATARAGATVIVPLEVLLQAQLAMSIDGAPGKRYNYHTCNPVGCVAQLGFTEGDIDAMKAGNKANLSMVSVLAPNQLIQMEMSLAGFTSAFDKLKVNQN